MPLASSALPGLLLIGSGSQDRQGSMLEDLARHARVVLLQRDAATWQSQHVHRSVVVDTDDVGAVLQTARTAIARDGIEAVVTVDEGMLTLVGEIVEHTSLKGIPREAATIVRDKQRQRELLARGPNPVRSALAPDLAAARALAARWGYPLVIKPRNLSGNLGVRFVRTPKELEASYADSESADPRGTVRASGLLVEECLEGPEFSIDVAVLGGKASVLFVSRILNALAPELIDTGALIGPGTAPPGANEALCEAACAAALACGLDHTIANVDVKWTRGQPRILEVNGRPGGLLPRLAALSSGVRVGEVLADVALGRQLGPFPACVRASGASILFPRRRMRFGRLDVPPALARQPWLHQVTATKRRGDELVPPDQDVWGYAGWALITGETAAEVEARITRVWDEVRILDDHEA